MTQSDTQNEPLDFDALYRQYSGVIYSRCKRFSNNPEEAKELTHEIFLAAIKGSDNFKGKCQPFTWLYRIATNICLNYLKKNSAVKKLTVNLDLDLSDNMRHGQTMEGTLFLKQIFSPFDRDLQRIGFLFFVENLTQEEIAEVLDISRKTVVRKVAVLKSKLAHRLSKEGEV